MLSYLSGLTFAWLVRCDPWDFPGGKLESQPNFNPALISLKLSFLFYFFRVKKGSFFSQKLFLEKLFFIKSHKKSFFVDYQKFVRFLLPSEKVSVKKISLHLIFRSIRCTSGESLIQYGLFGITFIKDHKWLDTRDWNTEQTYAHEM